MTETEYDLQTAELRLKEQRLLVKAAKFDLDEGTKRVQARAALQVFALKCSYDAALIDLERAELDVKAAREREEKPF
jgi:hypothetical protein